MVLAEVTAGGVLANTASTAVIVSVFGVIMWKLGLSGLGDFVDRRVAPIHRRIDMIEHRQTVQEARAEGRKEALAEIAAAKSVDGT